MRLKKKNDRVAVALVLCFCVVAIASVFSMRSNLEKLDPGNNDNINIAQENKGSSGDKDVVKPVPTVDSTQTKDNSAEEKPEKKNTAGNSIFTIPVQGKITKDFSKDVPVFSQTLDQYVVHEGVDIESAADTQVLAAAEGTVTKVYTDDKLGLTIEITHGDGIITKYSNLSTIKMVGEGDVVKKGQPISGVGNTALFESLEPSHLHFEVLKGGVPIDPKQYIQ